MRSIIALHPPVALLSTSITATVIFWGSWLLAVSIPACLVFLFDVRGRWKDYQILMMSHPHPAPNHLRKLQRSWCGRTVVKTVYPEMKTLYRALGYRWYHVFPDGSLSRNSVFLKVNFWKELMKGV